MIEFEIPVKPKCTKKTISFPNPMIQAVEKQIQWRNSSFSAFVVAAVEYVLEELEKEEM